MKGPVIHPHLPNKRLKLAGGDRSKGSGVLCAGAPELSFNNTAPCGRVARSLSAIRQTARVSPVQNLRLMRIRLRYLALALFILTGIAAAMAVSHMDNFPAFVVIGPGYVVQAWLFETHRALGGFGYQVTVVGVSALVWTLIILAVAVAIRLLRRLVRRPRAV